MHLIHFISSSSELAQMPSDERLQWHIPTYPEMEKTYPGTCCNALQCPAMPCNVWCVNYGWLWIVMLRRGPLFRQQSPIWSLNTILEVWAIKKLKILEVFSRDTYTMIHTSWFCISLSAGSVVLMVFPLSAHAHLVARTYFRLIQGCRHTCHHLPHRTWRKYLT